MSEVVDSNDLYELKHASFIFCDNKAKTETPFNIMETVLSNTNNTDIGLSFMGSLVPLPRYPGTNDHPNMLFRTQYYDRPVKFLKDNIIIHSSGVSSPRDVPQFKMFKTNLQSLFEAGIIPYKLKAAKFSYYYELHGSNFKVAEDPPKFMPMNFTLLEAGFVIWLIAVAITILVFFGEIIFFHASKFFDVEKLKINTFKAQKQAKMKKLKWSKIVKNHILKTMKKQKSWNSKIKSKKMRKKLDLMKRLKCWMKMKF